MCDAPGCLNAVEAGGTTVFATERELEAAAEDVGWYIDDDGRYWCPNHNRRTRRGGFKASWRRGDRDL